MGTPRWRVNPTWASLPLELIAGTIFFAHGLQKLTDIPGFGERALSPLGVPPIFAYAVASAEFGGGLLLLAGLLVRLAAFGHFCVMAGAVVLVHWQNGLTGPGGFEFPLALLGSSIAVTLLGADPLSIDHNFTVSTSRFVDVKGMAVKTAGLFLVLAGIGIPVGRMYLGIPEGPVPLAIAVAAGLAAVVSGGAIIMGKQRAYMPAFALARFLVGGSALLLLWRKYTIRGAAALVVSLLILTALRSARRRGDR